MAVYEVYGQLDMSTWWALLSDAVQLSVDLCVRQAARVPYDPLVTVASLVVTVRGHQQAIRYEYGATLPGPSVVY